MYVIFTNIIIIIIINMLILFFLNICNKNFTKKCLDSLVFNFKGIDFIEVYGIWIKLGGSFLKPYVLPIITIALGVFFGESKKSASSS